MTDSLTISQSDENNSRKTSILNLYSIDEEDIKNIRAFGKIIVPKLDQFLELFYQWLKTQPEFEEFFPEDEVDTHVLDGQRAYWNNFFEHEIDNEYIEERSHIGETHARIGLPLSVYFAAMNRSLGIITVDLYDHSLSSDEYLASVRAMTKLVHLDTGVVVETYTRMTGEAISAQSRTLMEMSTPVTQIWEGVLLLPIVGIVDSKRAHEIMNATLKKIAETQARAFIMDISGVAVVDTAVANYLIKVTKATRLMGCECTISGVSPAIAQTIVELGIDVGKVKSTATMQDALSDAFNRLDLKFGGEE